MGIASTIMNRFCNIIALFVILSLLLPVSFVGSAVADDGDGISHTMVQISGDKIPCNMQDMVDNANCDMSDNNMDCVSHCLINTTSNMYILFNSNTIHMNVGYIFLNPEDMDFISANIDGIIYPPIVKS